MRTAIATAILALALAPATAKPRRSATSTEAGIRACIIERTGPDGGLALSDAVKLCKTIERHERRIRQLAAKAQRALWECREEVSIACEDTTLRSEDNGECSDATLTARGAFDVCTAVH